MTNRTCLILVMLVWPVLAGAQQPQPAYGLENNSNSDAPLAVPIALNGQGGSLAFQSETPAESLLSGAVRFTGAYSDNALLTSTNKIGNFAYTVHPELAWSQITPRLTLNVGMDGGLMMNTNIGVENQSSESANLQASWRLTQHLTLRVDDSFSNTTGLFSSIGSAPLQSSVGPVETPNNTLLVPGIQRVRSNVSLAEVSDQVGPNTTVGARGTYWILNYPSSSQSAQFGALYDSRAYSVEGFYTKKMTPRQWLGVTVRQQRFQTSGINSTGVQSLVLYYSVTATPTVALTFFGGPEYSEFSESLLSPLPTNGTRRLWSSSEGATIARNGSKTSLDLTFVRQLSDGGGLDSSVTLQTVSGNLRRQLARNNELQFGTTYSKSDPLVTGPAVTSLSASATDQQRIAKNFSGAVGYTWEHQSLPGSTAVSAVNSAWFSLSYGFTHALGK